MKETRACSSGNNFKKHSLKGDFRRILLELDLVDFFLSFVELNCMWEIAKGVNISDRTRRPKSHPILKLTLVATVNLASSNESKVVTDANFPTN